MWQSRTLELNSQGVRSRFWRREELRQPPCMTVNNEQQSLLIFSIPCTARSCSSVVQRALIFWFDYKIKKKFPSEDVKADIFTKSQTWDRHADSWASFSEGLNAPRVTFYPHTKIMPEKCTHLGTEQHRYCTIFQYNVPIPYHRSVLAQLLTFMRSFSRGSVTLIFLGFTLSKSCASSITIVQIRLRVEEAKSENISLNFRSRKWFIDKTFYFFKSQDLLMFLSKSLLKILQQSPPSQTPIHWGVSQEPFIVEGETGTPAHGWPQDTLPR